MRTHIHETIPTYMRTHIHETIPTYMRTHIHEKDSEIYEDIYMRRTHTYMRTHIHEEKIHTHI